MTEQLDLFASPAAPQAHTYIIVHKEPQLPDAAGSVLRPVDTPPMSAGHGSGPENDSQTPQWLEATGMERKREGIEAVSIHNSDWLAWIRKVAKDICRRNGSVASDDLRTICQTHKREPDHPNAWGAVFREAGWEPVGRRQSATDSAHAREVKVWRWNASLDRQEEAQS